MQIPFLSKSPCLFLSGCPGNFPSDFPVAAVQITVKLTPTLGCVSHTGSFLLAQDLGVLHPLPYRVQVDLLTLLVF